MDNFLKGAVFGAAVALVGAYLLGTDKGKEETIYEEMAFGSAAHHSAAYPLVQEA